MWWKAKKEATPERAKVRLDGSLRKWENYLGDIHFLILSTDDVLVYLDSENDVDWTTSDDYDWGAESDTDEFNAILNRAALLESTPCDDLEFRMRRHFKRLVGEAVARALEKDFALAKSALDSAETYIRARSQERSRFWYLSSSATMTVPFLLGALLLWLFRLPIRSATGDDAFWLAMAASCGAAGALLSVVARTGQLTFDSSAGKATHYLEGASRIWAGALSGVIVALAVRAGLVLSAFGNGRGGTSLMLLAALASGASERLASSILSQIAVARSHTSKNVDNQAGSPS